MEPLAPKLILVPTDFSEPAAHALRYASALGERFDAHLLVIYADYFVPAVDFTASAAGAFDYSRETLIEESREALQRHAEENIAPSVPFDVRVIVGGTLDAIETQIRASGANLVVMGTHGRTGVSRLLFGSVTEAVMRSASVPVVAVPPGASESGHIDKVLCPVTFTPANREALRRAAALVDARSAPLVLLVPGMSDVVRLKSWVPPDLVDRCAMKVISAGNATAIVDVATAGGADLIAIGIDEIRGTLAGQVLRQSRCAVLTVNASTTSGLQAVAELAGERVRVY